MKWFKVISGIAYFFSFIIATSLFFGFRFGINITSTTYLFLGLGAVGFILNLLSFKKDKLGNPRANLFFWLGSLIMFSGLTAIILHYPYSTAIIIVGFFIFLVSLFRYRKSFSAKNQKDDILDQN